MKKLKTYYGRTLLVIFFVPYIGEYILRELWRSYRNMWMRNAIQRGYRQWKKWWIAQ